MTETVIRGTDAVGIPLQEIQSDLVNRDQTGIGVSTFSGLAIPTGTDDLPPVVYLEATYTYPETSWLALYGDQLGQLADFLSRDWIRGLDAYHWPDGDLPFIPPDDLREVIFQIRRVFIAVPSSAGSED